MIVVGTAPYICKYLNIIFYHQQYIPNIKYMYLCMYVRVCYKTYGYKKIILMEIN